MITSIFLNIIYSVVSFFINILPAGGYFPPTWASGIATVWNDVNAFSFIVPVDTLLQALTIAVAFHLFQFTWNFFHWLYGLIRGSRMH